MTAPIPTAELSRIFKNGERPLTESELQTLADSRRRSSEIARTVGAAIKERRSLAMRSEVFDIMTVIVRARANNEESERRSVAQKARAAETISMIPAAPIKKTRRRSWRQMPAAEIVREAVDHVRAVNPELAEMMLERLATPNETSSPEQNERFQTLCRSVLPEMGINEPKEMPNG